MRIFNATQRYFTVLGIQSPKRNRKTPLTAKNSMVLIILIGFLILAFVFFAFKAQNFEDRTNSFYVVATLTLVILTISIYTWKASELFQYVSNFEKVIEMRKFKLPSIK